MTAPPVRVSREWLALREPADAAARSRDLVDQLQRVLPATGPLEVHDLGGGTGAMGRWLAPLLPGQQHWVVHDRDRDLLGRAVSARPGPAVDGGGVTVEARYSDITRIPPTELADAALITASALLDMLTEAALDAVVNVCSAVGCPILITLSVVGRVELTPPDPLDRRLAVAFDAHQRRETDRGRLLGPDAAAVAADRFAEIGAKVLVRPSPWRLGAPHSDLAVEWFTGWVRAACEQEAELAGETGDYTRRRLAQAAGGELGVLVDHADLLILPGPASA